MFKRSIRMKAEREKNLMRKGHSPEELLDCSFQYANASESKIQSFLNISSIFALLLAIR